MIRTIALLAACGILITPTLADAKSKRRNAEEVQREDRGSKDSVEQSYVKENGEICYRQTMMVTGGGRPTDAWAKSAALKAWRAEVKKIHGIRFTDLERANKPEGTGKGAEVIALPPEFGQVSYVVKGKPCAVSF